MPGSLAGGQVAAADVDAIAVTDHQVGAGGAAVAAEHHLAAGEPAQGGGGGDVVGVDVGLEHRHQLEAELVQELGVALVLLQHRIDEHRLARVGEQIGIGAGVSVEQLAQHEDEQ